MIIRAEIILVRFSVLFISSYLITGIILAWDGYDISSHDYLLGHSIILDALLLVLCMNNSKYHCKYLMALCANNLFTAIIGYLDNIFGIIPSATNYLYLLSITSVFSILITIFLSIRHFITKRKNRFWEYKLSKNGRT